MLEQQLGCTSLLFGRGEMACRSAATRCLLVSLPNSYGQTLTDRRNTNTHMHTYSGQADTAEEVGLDRTHPQEASIQHHTPSPDLEPAREEEERPASQQLEARH